MVSKTGVRRHPVEHASVIISNGDQQQNEAKGLGFACGGRSVERPGMIVASGAVVTSRWEGVYGGGGSGTPSHTSALLSSAPRWEGECEGVGLAPPRIRPQLQLHIGREAWFRVAWGALGCFRVPVPWAGLGWFRVVQGRFRVV